MKRFKEKTVVVTGAGSGIGRATAIRFAEEGASVVLVGRTAATLEETAKELPQDRTWIHTDNYLIITCDISVQSQVQEMVERAIDKFGKIDILVNNAGKATQGKITELSADDWRSAIDVNLNGTFYVSQAAMPHLIASKGNIVNISSLSGVGGDWNMAAYNAAKAGVTNLTRTLALDHGSDGVRVNAVNPSVTKTDMTTAIQDNESKTDKFLARCPLGRLATPEDIAAAITFLASDDAP
ncbi:3-oxoacyl-[acyl-carrier protein] reductase [Psychrobacter sp. JCM 18901]|uniref:SDR family NAD(P)-dependent oxidoreductase n=1 Tax=Psychrobacter sp. JCM 18901 TaxID=1298609 RepID=UPI00043322F2|nr:SDR family oxidoreductase [Psychrobacter sp. JCM 18901]GAF57265.1 3-oxoacyl-[acyl-carrier protein] reductase [Psychrobacter sp. JCM 18901]